MVKMKRILIIGSGGAGKSTFSKQLSKILDLPIIHLDVHFWLPGWEMTESKKWHNKVDELISQDSWVMDGNFNSTLDKRFKRADTIFYFDFSSVRCLYNAFKRMIHGRYFFKKRSDMAEGCREKFDMEFYKWIWNFNKNDIKTVRAIVSSKLLDIYNSSFAPANDLPKLSEKIVVGRKLKLMMGKNSFAESGKSISTSVVIIGMDSNVEFLGITLPAVILKKIAKEINTPVTISSIKLFFDTSAEMIKATKEITSKGYQIKENDNDIFRTLNNYLSRIDIILFLPIIFILIIIFIFIQNQLKYMLLNLKKEMGIQIAMGVYYNDVIKIWLFQYTKFIISGMIVGGAIAYLTVKTLTNSNTDKIISNMIQLEYNIEIFAISSVVIIFLTLIYMYFKILSFFKNNSIVQLMTKE